jgi:hypothetical protein
VGVPVVILEQDMAMVAVVETYTSTDTLVAEVVTDHRGL